MKIYDKFQLKLLMCLLMREDVKTYDDVHKRFLYSKDLLSVGLSEDNHVAACYELPSGEWDRDLREVYYDTEDNRLHVSDNVLGKMNSEFGGLDKDYDNLDAEPSNPQPHKDAIGGRGDTTPIKCEYSSMYGKMVGVNNDEIIRYFLRKHGEVIVDGYLGKSCRMDGLIELKSGDLAGFRVGSRLHLNELYFDETDGEIHMSSSVIGGVFDTTLPNLEESIRRYNNLMRYECRKISRLVRRHPHVDIIVGD